MNNQLETRFNEPKTLKEICEKIMEILKQQQAVSNAIDLEGVPRELNTVPAACKY